MESFKTGDSEEMDSCKEKKHAKKDENRSQRVRDLPAFKNKTNKTFKI